MDTPAAPGPTPAPAQPAPPPPRRWRKRIVVPAVIVAIFALVFLWAYVRGTWADTAVRNPDASSEGVVCQLYRTPDGHVPVRCAVVIDRPARDVWNVVTDYEHYGEIFPTLHGAEVKVERDADGRHHLSGIASSVLGDWPFDIRIRHEESPDKSVASWNAGSGDVRVNRGSWTVTPLPANRALLVYSLEVKINSYPDFLINNVLLSRQPGVVKAVLARLQGAG